MNTILWIIVIWGVYFLYMKVTGPKVTQIDGKTLERLRSEKGKETQFVDVRTASEVAGRKIKGFKNIPLQSLSTRLSELDKEKAVILLCATGSRSMMAARILHKGGYTQLLNVKGGIAQNTLN